MGWRKAAVDAAQIAGFFTVVIALWVAIITMQDTQDEIKILQGLVESTQNQTEALGKAIQEIRHQTILGAYSDGGIFDVRIDSCSTSGKVYDRDDNFVEQNISFKPIMISESGAQTIVPFRIFSDLIFDGKNEIDSKNSPQIKRLDLGTFIYDPNHEERVQQVAIHEVLDKAEESGYKFVEINHRYSFRPFSPAIDVVIADQSKTQEKPLALMELTENGWQAKDIHEKYDCVS